MLEIRQLTFGYGTEPVLQNIDISIERGQLVSLLGPSGCGKSTLLRLVAGLEAPTYGFVRWQGEPVTVPSLRRAIVFQDYSLFPWMSLRQNVELAVAKASPELRRLERRSLAENYLAMVGLSESAPKHPGELSGGMRQRGAIARTLALGSDLLLLDEPFGALDPVNRARLQDLLLDIWARSSPRKTVLLVTHDIDEALLLGGRILVLGSAPGRVIADLDVPFTYPRSRGALFDSPECVRLQERIAALYRQDLIAHVERPAIVNGPAEAI